MKDLNEKEIDLVRGGLSLDDIRREVAEYLRELADKAK
jgi:hypothetical protein